MSEMHAGGRCRSAWLIGSAITLPHGARLFQVGDLTKSGRNSKGSGKIAYMYHFAFSLRERNM